MLPHLTFFVALALSGKAQAGPPADVVVAGPLSDVAVTAKYVWALQPQAVVVLSHEGQILQRLPLPPSLAPAVDRTVELEQAARDKALFDKFGIPDSVRDSVQAETWLDANRTRADRAATPTSAPATPGRWLMRASRDVVYLASAQALWQVRDGDRTLRRVVSLPSPPLSLAATAEGTVALGGASLLHVVQTQADVPMLQTCGTTLPSAWLTPLVALHPEAVCESQLRSHQAQELVRVPRSPTGETLTIHTACNAGGRVFANTGQGLFVSTTGVHAWQHIGGPAPFPELTCNDAEPDVLLSFSPRGVGAALSMDAGAHWESLPGLEGQPAINVAATETMVWVATAFGLLAVSPQTPSALPQVVPHVLATPRPSAWRALVPQVHLLAQWQQGESSNGDKTTAAAAFLSAEFLLDGKDTAVKQAAAAPIRARELPHTLVGQAQPPPCLARLRDSATALAMANPERMHAMAGRARAAGWLPELRFRAEKRWGRNQSVDLEDGTTFAPLGVDTVNDLRVEIRATWDLARALYSPDELAVAAGTLRVMDARQEISTLVNRLFFERRRLAAVTAESAPAPTSEIEDREPLAARIGRLTADIDALTGGLAQSCW